jgi:hypothetical protein
MRTMPAMTGKETSVSTYHDLIEMLPIASAPVRHGKIFGPCLLLTSDPDPDEWVLGRWSEIGWYTQDGLPCSPTHFALLPVTAAADRDPFALARAAPNG